MQVGPLVGGPDGPDGEQAAADALLADDLNYVEPDWNWCSGA
jgi:hypothetical protein